MLLKILKNKSILFPDVSVFGQDSLKYYSDHCTLYVDTSNPVKAFKIQSQCYSYFLIGNFTFYKNYFVACSVSSQNSLITDNDSISIEKLFEHLSGTYCCIQIHNFKQEIIVYTDYLGFYPLYLYHDDEQYIFSSEIKWIKANLNKTLTWNPDAMQSYIDNGHLVSNQSWFKEIVKLRPSSAYNIDCKSFHLTCNYYWTWAQMKKSNLSKSDLLESYKSLFENGISRLKLDQNHTYGLSLSGGLDSRWIGFVANKYFNLKAFSFGDEANYEIELAKSTAEALKVDFTFLSLDKSHWLQHRLAAFWKTDGMLHLGHLHEARVHDILKENYPTYFHGFFGGGVYASSTKCNQRITTQTADRYFIFRNSLSQVEDSFYNVNSIDPYLIDQKIRNQAAHSIYLLSSNCRLIIPFYNLDWMCLNYSINDDLQLHSKFYLEVLNKQLSKELLKIPWQRTGIPPQFIRLNTLAQKTHLPAIKEKIFQNFSKSRHFINYNSIDAELDLWINHFIKDIKSLDLEFMLSSREQKFRVLSLVLIMLMMNKNSCDVL